VVVVVVVVVITTMIIKVSVQSIDTSKRRFLFGDGKLCYLFISIAVIVRSGIQDFLDARSLLTR
jgi:hypothetical protein